MPPQPAHAALRNPVKEALRRTKRGGGVHPQVWQAKRSTPGADHQPTRPLHSRLGEERGAGIGTHLCEHDRAGSLAAPPPCVGTTWDSYRGRAVLRGGTEVALARCCNANLKNDAQCSHGHRLPLLFSGLFLPLHLQCSAATVALPLAGSIK